MGATCHHCGAPLWAEREKPLTRKQARLYAYLTKYRAKHGCAPSLQEIAEQFGYRSLSTVHELLGHLEAKGYLRRDFRVARGITLRDG